MNKFIRKVTITGLDIYSNRQHLLALQREFPFVEWGILLSNSKAGKDNRYPPIEWISETLSSGLNLSGHLCGQWARDAAFGGDQFVSEYSDWLKKFQRIQLNVSGLLSNIGQDTIGTEFFYRGVEHIKGPRPIIQIRQLYKFLLPLIDEVDFLFDCSGGKGVLPNNWPDAVSWFDEPIKLNNCGYAGGLNPDNLVSQIESMEKAASGMPVWIDVESGVRTNEVLDFEKVLFFLQAAEPYVIDGIENGSDCSASETNSASG